MLRLSFTSVRQSSVLMLLGVLIAVSLLSMYTVRTLNQAIHVDLATQERIRNIFSEVAIEFTQARATFYQEYNQVDFDVGLSLPHLDCIRDLLQQLDSFSGNISNLGVPLAGVTKHISREEMRLRSALYAFSAANLEDPSRDYFAQEVANVQRVIEEATSVSRDLCKSIDEASKQTSGEIVGSLGRITQYLTVGLIGGLFLTAVISWWMTRSLGRMLDEIAEANTHLAKGDLSYRIRSPFNDALGRVAHGIDAMAADLEKSDRELKASIEKAQTANRAKSEFLATMSHEIRTPMNGLIGMIDLMMNTEHDSNQRRRYMHVAKTSANSLMTVINDILDFSKIEAGKLELERLDFDIVQAVEDSVQMFATKAAEKGLELLCHIDPSVPRWVNGDPCRLCQVIKNLVNNAIKFTKSGEVAVRVALREQDPDGRHAMIRFEVTDTGPGISVQRRDRLFKSFSQVDASTTRQHGGTGLGLAISKRLVELMDGTIGAESEASKGSTFWFEAQLGKPEAAHGPKPDAPRGDELRDARVLIIDDNKTNREIQREQLRRHSSHVEVADGGMHGLEKLKAAAAESSPFDLVVLDRCMPDMDGLAVADLIKQSPTIQDTRLILMTSVDDTIAATDLATHGLAGCVNKPVCASELLRAVSDALTRVSEEPECRCGRKDPRAIVPLTDRTAGIEQPMILLAEDNEINQLVASEILTRAGYKLEIVSDGKQAVEAVKHNEYDLVLMDCQMPNLDGFDATAAIRELERSDGIPPFKKDRLPIIALTANAVKGDRDRCLAAGMDDYLTKPLDPIEMIQTIEKHLKPAAALVKPSVA